MKDRMRVWFTPQMLASDSMILKELEAIATQYDVAGGDLKMQAFDELMGESDKLQAELWRRAVERGTVEVKPAICDALFHQLQGRWGEININELATRIGKLMGDMDSNPFLDPEVCEGWKNLVHELKGIDYSWGGYMEDRAVVWAGHYHEPGATIHLGVDFYVPARTLVYLPVPGTLLYQFQDPDQKGGWGGKQVYDTPMGYLILGHMKEMPCEEKKHYPAGIVVGQVAESDTNGGWSPHLHVQLMRKYSPHVDGYGKKYERMELDFPNPIVEFEKLVP